MGFDFQMPNGREWLLYIALGIITVVAQIWMTDAYAYGNPVVVSFVAYIAVVFNALWGFVFFDEVLTVMTIMGGICIVGGSMYLTKLKHDRIRNRTIVTVRERKG